MSDKISLDDVRDVARLSRLKLTEAQLEAMAGQLGRVLEYVAILDELDTSNVEPLVQAVEVRNAFRLDEVTPSLSREDALLNSPQTDGECFLVPDILQKG